MTSLISSHQLFTRTSKRLKRVLPSYLDANDPFPHEVNFKDATAFVLGHENFHAHNKAVSQANGKITPRDEDLTRVQLCERRDEQAHRLAAFLATFGVQIDCKSLIDEWRPTSVRPLRPTLTTDDIANKRNNGVPQKALQNLVRFAESGEIPSPDELVLIYNALRCSTGLAKEWLSGHIGPIAADLANMKTGEAARVGFELLEMLVETGFTFAQAQLAQLVFNGWGTTKDMRRARALCEKTDKALADGEIIFTLNVSEIDFLVLKYKIWSATGTPEDSCSALEFLKQAVAIGSAKAALLVAHHYFPDDIDSGCPRIVEPDFAKVEQYMQLAIDLGYSPEKKGFLEHAL